MKKKSLNAKKITHKYLLKYLKNPKIKIIYKSFERLLVNNKLSGNLAVAVSGGPDSMALTFLARCYSIIKHVKIKYYHLDHRLRENSYKEAKSLKSNLKKFDINCKIIIWKGKKPKSNVQSIARKIRYNLLVNECIKDKVKTILIAHHIDDLYESFIIRLLRGSGLKGLTSFSNLSSEFKHNSNIKILRPLINQNKKNLLYTAKKVFNFYINDSSNENILFKRVRVRNLINNLKNEGLDEKKLKLTIDNLTESNITINYYVNENIRLNTNFLNSGRKLKCIINKKFFNNPKEVIFRSMGDILRYIGKNYYAPRGKSVVNLLNRIGSENFNKTTLSGCIIEKINNSVIIYGEKSKKI